MFPAAFLAVFAAIPIVTAQNVTSTTTKCTTSFGMQSLTTGTVETFYAWPFPTTTNIINITSTSFSTVTATRSASTVMQFMTSTFTLSLFSTVIPTPETIAAPAGFLPLLAFNSAGPTATGTISRFKRHELEGQDAHLALQLLKRQEQTPANSTTGFIVDRNGNAMSLQRKYPRQVNCRVNVNVNMTMTTVVAGPTETMWATGGIVPTAMLTFTTTTTTVLTAVAPRRTVYAACQPNNIVNSVQDTTGKELVFDRVIYRPTLGFPMSNELITNTTCAENCCIACQRTPFCAGSFYVPSNSDCHLRLTQPPTQGSVATYPTLSGRQIDAINATLYSAQYGNITYPYGFNDTIHGNTTGNATSCDAFNRTYSCPTAAYPTNSDTPRLPFPIVLPPYPANASFPADPTGYPIATGTSPSTPLSTSSPLPNTCPRGSLSLYLGTIMGQNDFPKEYALSMSNGPCGRFSVWPIPVNETSDPMLVDARKRGIVIGM